MANYPDDMPKEIRKLARAFQPPSDFRDFHAENFVRAAELLWDGAQQGAGTGIPALTCASLGAELSLKALLARRGTHPGREHDLRMLLQLLPMADYEQIVSQVSARFTEWEKHMADAANAFVDWRYVYEAEEERSVNVVFVITLARAIAVLPKTVTEGDGLSSG